MQQTRNGSLRTRSADIHAPCSCLRALDEHLGKNSVSSFSCGTGPCYLSHPGTNPGCRARETMVSYSTTCEVSSGINELHFDTCSIAIVCRSRRCPACVMMSSSLAKYQCRKPSAIWCHCVAHRSIAASHAFWQVVRR